ncbi:MAG: YebC/PmpR family DNA-binding transcriptional regulator [Bacteroidales bacterium]
MSLCFRGKFVFEFEKTDEVDIDELELELIDFGLDEIVAEDDTIYAYADYTDFGVLSKAFEEKGIKITKANLQRIPTSPVEFTEEQLVDIEKMLDKIEDDDDVQATYTNIA